MYSSKGAIHYITETEIEKAKPYLINKIKSQKVVSLILGGPNKYYSFDEDQLIQIFNKIKSNFVSKGYKVIVIPSMRTPKASIELAKKEMGFMWSCCKFCRQASLFICLCACKLCSGNM